MNTKRQAFYKSKRWESFVQTLRRERARPDGSILCEYCGMPIVRMYDCIGHHKEELTEENVDNVMIALNPDNVQLVHFRCHNAIHKRFGYNGRQVQKVYIVWGAPCSGKRLFVDNAAEPNDIILDIDALWRAVQRDATWNDNVQKPNALKANVFALRDCLLDQIKTRRGRWDNAYIIGGYPLQGERERIAAEVGAERLIHIDTPKEICLSRSRTPEQEKYISDWFEKFSEYPPGQV